MTKLEGHSVERISASVKWTSQQHLSWIGGGGSGSLHHLSWKVQQETTL